MFYTPQAMRFELLKALYQHARQQPDAPFSEAAIEETFGVSPIQLDLVVDWLVQRGYVRCEGPAGHLAITPAGTHEMEARDAFWRREREAHLDWLEQEQARITAKCAADPTITPLAANRLKKAAVEQARERRKALEARFCDLSEPLAPS